MDHTTRPTTALLADAAAAALVSNPDDRAIWDLIYALQERPTRDVFEAAAAWCRSPSPPLRGLGVAVLGELGLEASLPFARESERVLLPLLQDPDASVVAATALALGTLGADDTATLCAAASHPTCAVRAAVARSLCDLAGPGVIATLIALTRDPSAEVRQLATSGLGGFDREDTEDVRLALVDRLADVDADTREEAIFALAQLGDERVDAALRAAREEPETSELIEMAAMAVECRRERDPRQRTWPRRPH
jgi:HEAT repeat protein